MHFSNVRSGGWAHTIFHANILAEEPHTHTLIDSIYTHRELEIVKAREGEIERESARKRERQPAEAAIAAATRT